MGEYAVIGQIFDVNDINYKLYLIFFFRYFLAVGIFFMANSHYFYIILHYFTLFFTNLHYLA